MAMIEKIAFSKKLRAALELLGSFHFLRSLHAKSGKKLFSALAHEETFKNECEYQQ